MTRSPFALLCYARKKGNHWIAACPQFKIVAEGADFDKAKGEMELKIKSYILEALALDHEHSARLLGRQAPVLTRLLYRFRALLPTTRFFEESALQYVEPAEQASANFFSYRVREVSSLSLLKVATPNLQQTPAIRSVQSEDS